MASDTKIAELLGQFSAKVNLKSQKYLLRVMTKHGILRGKKRRRDVRNAPLARSQNCQIWNGRSCQELTKAIYGEHRLWTLLLKIIGCILGTKHVIHIAKPCSYFGFGAKTFLVMYPCENCCQLNEYFV